MYKQTIYVVVCMSTSRVNELFLTEHDLVRMQTTLVSNTPMFWSACRPVGFKGLNTKHIKKAKPRI